MADTPYCNEGAFGGAAQSASMPTKVKTGGEGITVRSSVGVRQGACEGPIVFLFIMQAAPETVE